MRVSPLPIDAIMNSKELEENNERVNCCMIIYTLEGILIAADWMQRVPELKQTYLCESCSKRDSNVDEFYTPYSSWVQSEEVWIKHARGLSSICPKRNYCKECATELFLLDKIKQIKEGKLLKWEDDACLIHERIPIIGLVPINDDLDIKLSHHARTRMNRYGDNVGVKKFEINDTSWGLVIMDNEYSLLNGVDYIKVPIMQKIENDEVYYLAVTILPSALPIGVSSPYTVTWDEESDDSTLGDVLYSSITLCGAVPENDIGKIITRKTRCCYSCRRVRKSNGRICVPSNCPFTNRYAHYDKLSGDAAVVKYIQDNNIDVFPKDKTNARSSMFGGLNVVSVRTHTQCHSIFSSSRCLRHPVVQVSDLLSSEPKIVKRELTYQKLCLPCFEMMVYTKSGISTHLTSSLDKLMSFIGPSARPLISEQYLCGLTDKQLAELYIGRDYISTSVYDSFAIGKEGHSIRPHLAAGSRYSLFNALIHNEAVGYVDYMGLDPTEDSKITHVTTYFTVNGITRDGTPTMPFSKPLKRSGSRKLSKSQIEVWYVNNGIGNLIDMWIGYAKHNFGEPTYEYVDNVGLVYTILMTAENVDEIDRNNRLISSNINGKNGTCSEWIKNRNTSTSPQEMNVMIADGVLRRNKRLFGDTSYTNFMMNYEYTCNGLTDGHYMSVNTKGHKVLKSDRAMKMLMGGIKKANPKIETSEATMKLISKLEDHAEHSLKVLDRDLRLGKTGVGYDQNLYAGENYFASNFIRSDKGNITCYTHAIAKTCIVTLHYVSNCKYVCKAQSGINDFKMSSDNYYNFPGCRATVD